MTIQEWLAEATKQLEAAGIGTARLDCLVLLEDTTGRDRSWLLAHPEYKLEGSQAITLKEFIKKRGKHTPLAYIRGKTEFYGREFMVNKHVLEPRPETEDIIELLLDLVKDEGSRVKNIVDVGTGSGCLAITAKLERPELAVLATEIDKSALKVAKENARKLNADITFYHGNLLEPLMHKQGSGRWILLANLPYVPNHYQVNQAAAMEPRLAIFGGADGLDLYRRFFKQIARMRRQPEYVITESLPPQHDTLKQLAAQAGMACFEERGLCLAFRQVT